MARPIGARATLLDLLPSVGPAWEKWLAGEADYEPPAAALTEPERAHEFLGRVASQRGSRRQQAAAGEAREVS